MRAMVAIFTILMSTSVVAQVYKCKDASGSITYSNMGCPASHSGQAIMRESSWADKIAERKQAYEAEIRKRESRHAKAEQQAIEDAEFAQAHTRQATAAAAGSSYSQRLASRNAGVSSSLSAGANRGMTRSQRELALSQAHTPQERAAAMREATTVMPGAQGLTTSQRDAAARLASTPAGQPIPYSASPTTSPPPAPPPLPVAESSPIPSASGPITHCNGGFCHDSKGSTYTRSTDDRFMHNTNTGQTCSLSSDRRSMVCH